jgi:hypothetical protein
MRGETRTKEVTLDSVTLGDISAKQYLFEDLEVSRAYIEENKRGEALGMEWIKFMLGLVIIFFVGLGCLVFGVFK